jgi:hypothetical protein
LSEDFKLLWRHFQSCQQVAKLLNDVATYLCHHSVKTLVYLPCPTKPDAGLSGVKPWFLLLFSLKVVIV